MTDKTNESAHELDTGKRKPLENLQELKDEQASAEQAPPKKKVKRGPRGPYKKRKKQEPEPVVENPIDAKVIENVYKLLFSTLADKNGMPHWNLSDDEARALSEATGAVLDKYAPMVAGYLPELNLAVTIVGIIGMKYYVSVQIAGASKQEEKKIESD